VFSVECRRGTVPARANEFLRYASIVRSNEEVPAGPGTPLITPYEAMELLTAGMNGHVRLAQYLAALSPEHRLNEIDGNLAWHRMWIHIYRDVIALVRAVGVQTAGAGDPELRSLARGYLGLDACEQGRSIGVGPTFDERLEALEFLCTQTVQETLEIAGAQGATRLT
jgi:hypothetical protein